MTATVLDGKAIAAKVREEVAREVAEFRASSGKIPKLVVILVGDDPASAVYVKNKQLACGKAGIDSELVKLPATTSQQELLDQIAAQNADPATNGILVQLPLPASIDAKTVLDAIHPLKDVDAFHPENVGLMVQERPRFLPCTPHGVLVLLHSAGIQTSGQHAVVIGRSEIVGKPMAALLVQKSVDATVTICHSRTRNLAEICRTADILIAAMGKPEFVTGEFLKPGVAVIDVGTNRVGDKLVGDVRFADALPVASFITPVPGGVGPMTIAMLLKSTVQAARLQAAAGH
ncbi:MAG: bifunctional 5,10-methylenetetrahydrofolate dehydrogenase/5,10-methenyltetrahydrofolate cyclohydrolase [Planctomycetaceae bacterium]|jgi:methylenetetrahydrofolate dehydrogenase (NADP+)/methenyltetrahydrofolate cyclohydrolase|nr:bifunctional 5,10-methylenetetrahydrofolate dehydrogenase/5,10-methenyltetrahydrofolate cyclohydrolase [Planctomycetaceae bacterium]